MRGRAPALEEVDLQDINPFFAVAPDLALAKSPEPIFNQDWPDPFDQAPANNGCGNRRRQIPGVCAKHHIPHLKVIMESHRASFLAKGAEARSKT